MNKLAIAFLATASLFSIAGCKKKGGGGSDMVSKYEGFAKQMCDCKDKACADKVNDEFTKWGQEMAKTAGKETSEKPDPEMVKKTTEASTKYSECYTKLAMAGTAGGDMAGSAAAGSAAAGSDTAGSAAAGSDTAGSAAAGSDTGSAAAGSDTAAPADDKKEETK